MKKSVVAMLAVALAACLAVASLAGCSVGSHTSHVDEPFDASSIMRIGTLQTEDSLPFWVAAEQGYYEAQGISVEIITFQSAQELSTAVVAGEVDGVMTDIMVASSIAASGVDMNLAWVTLGEDATQGRFGIMTSPESGITSLADLAGKGVGVGSNTVPEYVMDYLLLDAGLAEDQIVNEEIKKLPVRYEAMTNNQVAAAALPGSLLALGEAQGMVLLADDTQGDNVSQSVFAVRQSWIDAGGAGALEGVRTAWGQAAADINASPESYRALLVEKANLPGLVADTYPIATYPVDCAVTSAMVDPVLSWMQDRNYLTGSVTFNEASGLLSAA